VNLLDKKCFGEFPAINIKDIDDFFTIITESGEFHISGNIKTGGLTVKTFTGSRPQSLFVAPISDNSVGIKLDMSKYRR